MNVYRARGGEGGSCAADDGLSLSSDTTTTGSNT